MTAAEQRVAEALAQVMTAKYPGTVWVPSTNARPAVRLADPVDDDPVREGGVSVLRAA